MSNLTSARAVTFVLVRDRARGREFYGGTLGLREIADDDFATVYDLNGATLRLTTVETYTPHPHTVLGWEVPDIVATARALSERGVQLQVYPGFGQDELGIWTAPDGSAKVAWFNDPEGNNLSLTQVTARR